MSSRYMDPSSSTRKSDDTMDDETDDKDDSKRKTRNLSEKKRRDQFNVLINELSSMVSTTSRKMDKSTVLKSTISFLKNHNDVAVQARAHEIQEDWKPSFLSNEEFTHLFLEALDGFIILLSSSGRIIFTSESITSLLGYFPNDLLAMTMYDIVFEGDHSDLYSFLLSPSVDQENGKENELSFTCLCKRGDGLDDPSYEIVQFQGQFRTDMNYSQSSGRGSRCSSYSTEGDTRVIFVGTGRLQTPQLIRELSVVDSTKSEFTSRHSLEWKFLFLDHRAPPIIGYLPIEVLGTSGYDYYHVDDLEKVVTCHEALMQKGEGTSCYYRFLTKGQQWIWLQTRFYITYHQWNAKPEFIVCTHRVVSYGNVLKQRCHEDSVKSRAARHSNWSKSNEKSEFQSKRDNPDRFGSDSVSGDSQYTSVSGQSRKARSDSCGPGDSKSQVFPTQTPQVLQPRQPVSTPVPLIPEHVDLLERRQEELQQKIVEQQTELRQVTEQLFMAKYGLFPPVINVTLPYTPELYISHTNDPPSDQTNPNVASVVATEFINSTLFNPQNPTNP